MTFSSLAAWQTDCFSLLSLHPNHAHCPLPIAYRPLPVAHCPMPIAHCLPPIAHCPLPSFQCPLPVFGQWNFLACTQSQKGNVQCKPSFMEFAMHFSDWLLARCSMTVQPYPCIMAQLMNMWVTNSFSSLPSLRHISQFLS